MAVHHYCCHCGGEVVEAAVVERRCHCVQVEEGRSFHSDCDGEEEEEAAADCPPRPHPSNGQVVADARPCFHCEADADGVRQCCRCAACGEVAAVGAARSTPTLLPRVDQ